VLPSRSLAVLTIAAHALAILAVLATLDGIALLLVLGGVSLSATWGVANSMLWLPRGVAGFDVMPDGGASWSDRAGGSHFARTIRAAWCSEFLLVVGLQGADRRWNWVLLLPDSAETGSLRRLRVWFRWRPD
jgi:hypothetical protein